MITETGFLLSYIKYGDNDAVIHVFTKENGYRSGFLRGIYSKKSRKKPYLFPLRELCLTFSPNQRSGLSSISKVELSDKRDFESNVKAGTVLFFIADMLNQILQNTDADLQVYDEISKFLNELEKGNFSAHPVFLIKMMAYAGIQPLITPAEFLNPESGSFESEISHQLFGAEVSLIFREIIVSDCPYDKKLRTEQKQNLLDALLVYYQYHIPDFRTPKTLEVVQQIFE